ncbi:hypothetical protein ACFVSN_02210 [Kitasatospora sp. NPDC057904]|uniref:hypothetical protein n=1 Tax=unclassified Kitasatospora TaxID=2633591 RepID=UPI0036DEA001
MTISKRITAAAFLSAVAVSMGGPAFAAEHAGAAGHPAHVRHTEPPVTALQCEEGGGWVATDIRERREFCLGGEFNDRYVVWI